MVYAEVDDLPGAFAVNGRYSVQDGQISAKLTLRRDGKVVGEPLVVQGKADALDAFAEQLALTIKDLVTKIPVQ